jgi:hypothetical protein
MRWEVTFNKNGNLVLEGVGSEESGAEIESKNDNTFDLYEITQYGCATLFCDNFSNINDAIKMAESWS